MTRIAASDTNLNQPTLARDRTRSWRLASGVGALAAVASYVGTTIVGGAIVPGYSHVADSVSSLTSPGAPYRAGLALGFAAYNLGVVVLGVALPRAHGVRSIPVSVAGALLVACGAAGVLMLEPFPQDAMGAPLTAAGTVHIVLAGVSAMPSSWLPCSPVSGGAEAPPAGPGSGASPSVQRPRSSSRAASVPRSSPVRTSDSSSG